MKLQRLRAAIVRTIARGPAVGSSGALLAMLLIVALGVIGVVDNYTGSGITFVVLYLVPVVAGSVFCTELLAVLVAASAAVVWSIGTAYATDQGVLDIRFPINSVLRLVVLGLIVYLIGALRDALLEARASEQRSQDFLAFAAHQLRTPTAAASTAAQTLLARGESSEQDEELLVRIAHETTRAGRLVGSVLQYLRMHHHRGLPRQPVDLDEVCREAIDRSRDVASVATIKAFVGAPPTPIVDANPDALIEAVCCLLDNARRHARRTVEVRTDVVGDHAELFVADDGPGLPPGQHEKAFDAFVSIDGRGGTGLGLTIARGLVEGQDGTLTYEHDAFVIRVPLAPHR